MTDVGDLVRFGNWTGATTRDDDPAEAFKNLAGIATNPTAVTLILLKPDGSFQSYGWPSAGVDGTLTNESAGRFYAEVLIDQSGTWWFGLAGTGAVTAASEGSLRVDRQRVVAP